MRLKEDRSSWHSHVIEKRDFRHDHTDLPLRFTSHKNTNKWCKGKVGIKHSVQWQKEIDFFGYNYKIGKCANCGKHMFGRV
jgi:hypothetical protein